MTTATSCGVATKVIATGRFSQEQPLQVGDPITISGQTGIVREVGPLLGERDLRLVLQLLS